MTRSGVIQVRVSLEERERMQALADGAGVRLSDWVRSRALGDSVTLSARDVEAAIRTNPEPVIDQKVLRVEVQKRMTEPHGRECPEYGCHWTAPSPNAVCPSHQRKIR